MIYFYNKFILFFLPLSFLPLILHLIFEKRTKTIRFTYINLIRKVISEYSPKKKLIDILVMILRCLIIMFVILFFATPVIYHNPLKETSLNLMLALDTSFSMQQKIINTTKLNLCKLYLIDLIKHLQRYPVKLKIVTFNDSVKILYDGNYEQISYPELIKKISNIPETYHLTNLGALLEYVESYKNPIDKIIVLTDLAEHISNFDEFVVDKKQKIENYKPDILFCYPEYDEGNFYIKNLELYLNKDEDFLELNFNVFSSIQSKNKINVKLFKDELLVDNKNVTLSENSKFNYFLQKENNLRGHLSLPVDSINNDNNFYFTFNANKTKTKILCFINEPIYLKGIHSKKFYIENLSHSDFNIKIIVPEENMVFIENFYDGIICVDINKIEDIYKYLEEDKIKIFFINETIDVLSYESFLKGIEFIEPQKNNSGFSLNFSSDINEEFKSFFEQFDYKNIKVYKKYFINVVDKEKWKVLFQFSDGSPAVITDQKTYLFSFSISKEDSNYVYKPLFSGFINYIFKKINSKINLKPYYYISEPIFLNDEIKDITPLISYYKFSSTEFYEKISDNIVKFNIPGIYKLNIQQKEPVYVAVNIPHNESSVTIIDKNYLKKQISSKRIFNNISFLDILKRNSKEQFLKWCFGREFSNEILIMIAIILIIETILSRLGKRVV